MNQKFRDNQSFSHPQLFNIPLVILGGILLLLIGLMAWIVLWQATASVEDTFTEQQMQLLVKDLLNTAAYEGKLPGLSEQIVQGNDTLFASIANIQSRWIPSNYTHPVQWFSINDLDSLHALRKHFSYLQFSQWHVRSKNRISITLINKIVVSNPEEMVILAGGGMKVEYQWQQDHWVKRITKRWIS